MLFRSGLLIAATAAASKRLDVRRSSTTLSTAFPTGNTSQPISLANFIGAVSIKKPFVGLFQTQLHMEPIISFT